MGAKIGPQMRARGMFLRFGIGLPYRKVVSAIEGLDSLGFTPAALLGFEKKAAERARPLAYDVAKKLRACEVNHADETHYTINGKPAQAWFHGNERSRTSTFAARAAARFPARSWARIMREV